MASGTAAAVVRVLPVEQWDAGTVGGCSSRDVARDGLVVAALEATMELCGVLREAAGVIEPLVDAAVRQAAAASKAMDRE